MELTGTVKHVFNTEAKGNDGSFLVRQMVLTIDGQKYDQHVPIRFVQDKTSLLDNLKEGSRVTVKIDVRGREYNGRWFSEIQGWAVNIAQPSAAPAAQPMPVSQDSPAPVGNNEEDDLPF